MAENKILKATNSIVSSLDSLDSDERMRAVQAALSILGEGAVSMSNMSNAPRIDETPGAVTGGAMTAKQFFDAKDPKTKIHQLAVAARYREEHLGADASSKDELRQVIKDARRNFDATNFRRDLNNARTKGIFNRGTGRDSAVLSHRGQNFVDTLPDQEAAKKVLSGQRKKKTKRKTKKKAAKKTK